MKKRKTLFVSVIFFISFALQFIFFIFILKINNLYKILNIKNTFYKIILLSNNIEKELKGFIINDVSFAFSLPSLDINKTFISDKKDFVIITYDKSDVLFRLYPSTLSARKDKTIKFLNVNSMNIIDRGFIEFSCQINNEIFQTNFYMNKNIYLFPDNFRVF